MTHTSQSAWVATAFRRRTGGSRSALELGDLGACERHIAHQAMFAEHERDDRLFHRFGVVVAARTFRRHRYPDIRADRPAGTALEVIARLLRHEQGELRATRNADRGADRGTAHLVIADRVAIDQQGPVATFAADPEPRLGDLRKYEDPCSL